jgi:hypothetical protein
VKCGDVIELDVDLFSRRPILYRDPSDR